MQIVAVPLFNRDMMVNAYMFRDLKSNNLFSTAQATNLFDGAAQSPSLEILNLVGLDAFTMGKPLFIPITDIMLLGQLQNQCREPAHKIIFVLEKPINVEQYSPYIQTLRSLGYRFAANYPINLQQQDPFLSYCDFIFLSQRPERSEHSENTLRALKTDYPHIQPIATHIYSDDVLQSLYDKGYFWYESRFYPVSESDHAVSPLKANSIQLINTVQDENFEFKHISDIIQRDPALSISLLRLVNAIAFHNEITNITQAVALLGQQEVRKWVTTAISKSLGADRPSEITRVSLIRAKFAENLAPLYNMAVISGELFLLGLFSVLDIILDLPMEEALEQVRVSENIKQSLLHHSGILQPVLEMVTDYENANWSAVSRRMIVHDIHEDDLSHAYLDTLLWYKQLITDEELENNA